MASAPIKPTSSIAALLAADRDFTLSHSISATPGVTVPKLKDDAAGNHTGIHGVMPLPTSPSSISPMLVPYKNRPPSGRGRHPDHQDQVHNLASTPPAHTPKSPSPDDDQMLDLLLCSAEGSCQPLSRDALANLNDSTGGGVITPNMLAQQHLPDILLQNGPIAIRHVLAYLTQSVPGFSRIAPTKARRLVVSALESRASSSTEGDVVFEKVGWGRWDARVVGQPPRADREGTTDGLQGAGRGPKLGVLCSGTPTTIPEGRTGTSPPASSIVGSYAISNTGGLQIPKARGAPYGSRDPYSGSWADESTFSSSHHAPYDHRDRDHRMQHDPYDDLEDMVGKMSLDDDLDLDLNDNDDTTPQRPRPQPLHLPSVRMESTRPSTLDDDGGKSDETDYEDWAAIGAAALRQSSLPHSSSVRLRSPNREGSFLSGRGHSYMAAANNKKPDRRRSSGTAAISFSRRGSSLAVQKQQQ